jgi:putative membrane protein
LPAPEIVYEEDQPDQPLVPAVARDHTLPKRFKWGAILVSAAFGLITMWAGLTATQLIEDLFARNQVLGWIGTGLLGLVLLAALAIIVREIAGLTARAQAGHHTGRCRARHLRR